jgi:hypothetical protein
MKFTEAVKLFSDGHVGHSLISTCSLPAESFPDESTWNQLPQLEEDEASRLLDYAYVAPIQGSSGPLKNLTGADKRNSFLELNAGAIRFTPDTRIWHADDLSALPQRTVFGASLLVIRILRDDASLSEPLIVLAGPMATPFNGDAWDTRDLLALDADAPLPPLKGAIPFPETFAPTSVSLSASPRDWSGKLEPNRCMDSARTKGNFVTIVDSSNLHSIVTAYDPGEFISSRIAKQSDVKDCNIWLPVASPDTDQPDPALVDQWYKTSPVPPNPREARYWDTENEDTLNSRPADVPYTPSIARDIANIDRAATHRHENASYMLLPRFLRMPAPATLPIGLVMRPSAMTGALFRQLVSYCINATNSKTVQWLDNALLDTWFAAVAANPDLFQVDAIPHSVFISIASPLSDPRLLGIRLHQEWALLSQILWDHSFANVPKGNPTGMLTRYAETLVDTFNTSDEDDALNKSWGFIPSVFRNPYLVRLRPLSTEAAQLTKANIKLITDAPADTFPSFINQLPTYTVDVPLTARGSISCPSFTRTAISTNNDNNLDQHSIFGTPRSTALSTPQNPFQPHDTPSTPPAKRHRTGDMFSLFTHRTENRQSDEDSVVRATSCETYNPVPANVPLSGTSHGTSNKDAGWCLPVLSRGQSALPTLDSPRGRSAALLTALRQSTISPKTSTQSTATTSGDDKQVTFEFSRELMLSSHAYKNPVHRLAFWTSFRCALVSDPPITTVGTNPARYDHDYLIAPGRLNPELLSLYRQAYQKKPNHPAFHELTTWFETECVIADTDNDNTVLPCHIQPSFFNTSVVQALLSVSFQSGYRLKKGEETTGVLTPWSFIRSLEDFANHQHPKIPDNGLTSEQVANILDNIIYLLSVMSTDNRDIKTLGTGHSAFSRFSPLAGHILLLAANFRRNAFRQHWDVKLGATARFTYTKAAFIAIAELFNLYETWVKPVEDYNDVFRQACCGTHSDLVLLTPAIDASGRRHLPFFEQWRTQINVFTVDRLQTDIPREGFFAKATPACYLPRSFQQSSSHTLRPTPAVSISNSAQSIAASTLSAPLSVRQQPPYNDRNPTRNSNRNQTINDQRNPGESRSRHTRQEQGATAQVPIITSAASQQGYLKPLRVVLETINRGRSRADKVHLPLCHLPGRPHPINLCFRFSADGTQGCPQPETCRYLHIDLQDQAWVRANIPRPFLDDTVAFLQRPEVAEFYQPTPELLAFLGRR